jgi:hypothetical protein
MPHWNRNTYIKTLIFAATAHGNQKVPGSDLPYLTHVTLVTMEVIAALANEEGLGEGALDMVFMEGNSRRCFMPTSCFGKAASLRRSKLILWII